MNYINYFRDNIYRFKLLTESLEKYFKYEGLVYDIKENDFDIVYKANFNNIIMTSIYIYEYDIVSFNYVNDINDMELKKYIISHIKYTKRKNILDELL